MSTQPTLKDYLGITPTSGLELVELVERGLPTKNLDLLKAKGLTFTEMAAVVISPRTLKHRKARGENLSPEETERAVRVARIIALAVKVFGEREKAMRWLRSPNSRLEDRTPLSFVKNESGGRAIEQMLWGIGRRRLQLMPFWRISNHADLTGLGGETHYGSMAYRRAGKRIVYLSEHPALALVENIVTLSGDPSSIPNHFQLLKISATGPASPVAKLTPRQLAAIDPKDPISTQAIGDRWLAGCNSALLRVPSIPSPESWNYLLNPLHPDAPKLKLEWAKHITYDRRLFRLSP